MTTTRSRTIFIAAPPGEVFAFINDPHHMPEWIPSMAEVSDVCGEGHGSEYSWVYHTGAFTPTLAGLQLTGQSVVTEYSPPTRLTRRTNGLAHSIWDFQLNPVGEGTELTLRITWKVPVPFIGHAVESWMARRNARPLGHAVENAMRAIEHGRIGHADPDRTHVARQLGAAAFRRPALTALSSSDLHPSIG